MDKECSILHVGASWVALVLKNPLANAGQIRDAGLIPGLGRLQWRTVWQHTTVFLLGASKEQRSLAGSSP